VAKKILTHQESDLFRQSVGEVRAVKSDKILLEKEHKPKPYPRKKALDTSECSLNDFVTEMDIDQLGIEDSLSFSMPGLQKNVLKKLRRGAYGFDAEIDLHGLSSQEAKQRLIQFLHRCVEDGCRSVHIIHGKGFRSPDNLPVLKNNLNSWLRQHQDVQAFCSALPKDGGTGAIIVLLQLAEKYRQDDATW
jgi:DNA-nicking Smr family endonuclease